MNTPLLMPNSTATLQEQYAKAWSDLLSATATDHERAHAKCWLTYRTIDGEVPLDDWTRQIEPVANGRHLRWDSSQVTAECYLFAKIGNMPMFRLKAQVIRSFGEKLVELPPMSTNYLRGMALLVYDTILHGDKAEAVTLAKEALAQWQGVWATFDPLACPWRFCEMRADCIALHAIMRMLDTIGEVKRKFVQAKWVDDMMATEKNTPWWKAMLAIQVHEKAIWNEAPTLVAQYQQIHAAKPHYGSGPGEQERDTIRAAIVEAIGEPNSVLDYGCGNSRLASQMFPVASMLCRYDPAIERLSRLPELRFEVGLCTDVLEHIPETELETLVTRLRTLAPTWYFTIHTGPAAQILPDGQNAHCTQHPAEWWQERLGGKVVWQKGQRFGLLVTW